MNPQPLTEEGKAAFQPFIPAMLDDYGLTLAEFRIVCHISRRGDCGAALPTIARVCRMDIKTAKRALRAVVACGIVRREFRIGETLRLEIAPVSEWKAPSPKDTLGPKTPQGVKRTGSEPKRHPTHLAQKTPYKGNPIEGNPFKGIPKVELPASINTERLAAKWEEWIAYRQGLKGCKDFDALFKRQAEWLARFGEPTAFEILETSLRNGWQGLFAPSRKTSLPPKPQTIQQHVPGVIDPAQIELPGTL